jgi:hemerythrin
MSENIEPAAPQSTQDIAASVIQEAEAQEPAPAETSAPEQAASPDASVVDDPADIAGERWTEEEQLLREFGFKRNLTADGKEHSIPRSKVLSMIASGLKRGKEKWSGERTPLERELSELKSFRDDFAAALRGDETAFIQEIAKHDPRYARFLQQKIDQAQAHQEPAAAATKPQPDVDLGNGRWTYSVEQNEKLVEWKANQLLDARLKPYEDDKKAEKERAETEKWESDRRERAKSNVAELQAKPEFGPIAADGTLTDFQQAVLDELRADSEAAAKANRKPTMSHLEAYYKVRADRLAVDHNAVREKVIKELQGAPKSTAVGRTGAEVTRKPGPRSTADIARQVIAEAG